MKRTHYPQIVIFYTTESLTSLRADGYILPNKFEVVKGVAKHQRYPSHIVTGKAYLIPPALFKMIQITLAETQHLAI